MKTTITFMMAIGATLGLVVVSALVFPDFATSLIPGWHTVIYPTETYLLMLLGVIITFFVFLRISRTLLKWISRA